MITTNLREPDQPIRGPGFRWDYNRPVVMGLGVTIAGIGMVVARFDRAQTLVLDLAYADDQGFALGYELISSDTDPIDPTAVSQLDQRLAQWELHADVVTGHGLDVPFKALRAAAAGLDTVRALTQLGEEWVERGDRPHRSRPQLIDTAADIAGAQEDLESTCAVAPPLHSWFLNPETNTARVPITIAAASVLLSARDLGWCAWQHIDLDSLITESGHRKWSGA